MNAEKKEAGFDLGEAEAPKAGITKVTRVPSPSRHTIYSNSTTVFGNQWDVQMYFGLLSETAPGQYEAVDQALVIMTPEHALALLKALNGTLKAFEERQGKIRVVQKVDVPED